MSKPTADEVIEHDKAAMRHFMTATANAIGVITGVAEYMQEFGQHQKADYLRQEVAWIRLHFDAATSILHKRGLL